MWQQAASVQRWTTIIVVSIKTESLNDVGWKHPPYAAFPEQKSLLQSRLYFTSISFIRRNMHDGTSEMPHAYILTYIHKHIPYVRICGSDMWLCMHAYQSTYIQTYVCYIATNTRIDENHITRLSICHHFQFVEWSLLKDFVDF